MTGRRARAPYDPRMAQVWRVATFVASTAAVASFAVMLGWLVVDWGITVRVSTAALVALVAGVVTVVTAALWTHAVDGPASVAGVYRPSEDFPDDYEEDADDWDDDAADVASEPVAGETS